MNSNNPSLADTSANSASIDEEIVAYLDGELDMETAAKVERRLADDPRYSARLNQLQRAWDMLDSLRRTEADDDFVNSTVAMVAVQAEEAAKTQELRAMRRRNVTWLALAAVVALSMTTAFALFQRRLSRENRHLVRDLPLIEHVDEYRNIDSLEFVKQLQRENLFPGEVDDGT
jgi:anti-sigma factor RsiW